MYTKRKKKNKTRNLYTDIVLKTSFYTAMESFYFVPVFTKSRYLFTKRYSLILFSSIFFLLLYVVYRME